jgi:alpha 1,6-mannosyltransferase
MSIPKIIWQTYKTDFLDLPDTAKRTAQTWKRQNKHYKYKYLNDQEVEDFVLKYYGKDWHNLLISVPLGVIKADIFRYLIIYKFGGIYTDLDTKCIMPIDTWIRGLKSPYKDYDAVFGAEVVGDGQYPYRICQWTFAAKPGLPVFKTLIDNVYDALSNTDWSKVDNHNHTVHFTSGPNIFSYSILSHLNLANTINNEHIYDPKVNLLTNVEFLNNHDNTLKNNLYFYGNEHAYMFRRKAVKHMFAGSSQAWNDGQYVQWKKQSIN